MKEIWMLKVTRSILEFARFENLVLAKSRFLVKRKGWGNAGE